MSTTMSPQVNTAIDDGSHRAIVADGSGPVKDATRDALGVAGKDNL